MWGCPAQAPQRVVQVGAPWLPPAFPDPAEGVPPTEALGPFCSPLSRGTISTTVRTRYRGRRGYDTPLPPHEHSPSRLWGPRCLGCPWCQDLPCVPAESGCVGGGLMVGATGGPTLYSSHEDSGFGVWRPLQRAPAQFLILCPEFGPSRGFRKGGRAPGQLSVLGACQWTDWDLAWTGYQCSHSARPGQARPQDTSPGGSALGLAPPAGWDEDAVGTHGAYARVYVEPQRCPARRAR